MLWSELTVSVVCNHVSSRESYIHTYHGCTRVTDLSTCSFRSVVLGLRRYVSSKESNVTGVIFDLFFTIKTRPASGGNVGVGSGWGMGVSKRVKCDGCHI